MHSSCRMVCDPERSFHRPVVGMLDSNETSWRKLPCARDPPVLVALEDAAGVAYVISSSSADVAT